MKLVRKWNPEDAPLIPNWQGPPMFRMVALLKDGANEFIACFYDSRTGKVYAEIIARTNFSGDFSTSDLWQIEDDIQWYDVLSELRDYEVLDTVETRLTQGMDMMTLHKELWKVPRTPHGCDAKGNPFTSKLTEQMAVSPSLSSVDHKSEQ